jgi:hypothetical protein
MSGELRTSQFRWTTTANSDFVIGSPDDVGSYPNRYLVFQTSTTPGYAANPHMMCSYNSDLSSWELQLNTAPGGGYLNLSDAAYKSQPNTFTGNNTFNNSTTLNAGVVINGVTTTINTTNLNIADSLITLNSGGGGASGSNSGISIEELGVSVAYLKTNASRTGWELKAPATAGIITLIPTATSVSLTMPTSTGTLALISDLPSLTNYVTLNTDQTITSTKTLAVSTGAFFFGAAGVNGSINGNGDGAFNSLNIHNLFSVNSSGVVAGAGASFNGNLGIITNSGLASINIGSGAGVGMFTSFASNSPTLSKYSTYLGVSGTYSTTNGSILTRNETSNIVSLELLSDMGSGSSIILADRTTGTRYEIYMNSGVLTVGLA